jgi:hypothetical protein
LTFFGKGVDTIGPMKGLTTGAEGIRRDGGGRLSAEGPMKSSKNNVTSHFMEPLV